MKFRIWNKSTQKYFKHSTLSKLIIDSDGTAFIYSLDSSSCLTKLSEYVIEPYTGQKDIKGQMVYVGDIMVYKGRWAGTFIRGVVKWCDQKHKFIIDCSQAGFQETPFNKWEIVGNSNVE